MVPFSDHDYGDQTSRDHEPVVVTEVSVPVKRCKIADFTRIVPALC